MPAAPNNNSIMADMAVDSLKYAFDESQPLIVEGEVIHWAVPMAKLKLGGPC